jgi:hypothetical protein
MLTKALLGCALLLAAAALAFWLIGRPFGGSDSDERARAVADGARFLSATSGTRQPAYHVAGAFRVAPGVWRVETKESLPRGDPRTPKYACITIQLDRFSLADFVQENGQVRGTVRGIKPIMPLGRCQQS